MRDVRRASSQAAAIALDLIALVFESLIQIARGAPAVPLTSVNGPPPVALRSVNVAATPRVLCPPLGDDDATLRVGEFDHASHFAVAEIDPVHTIGQLSNDANAHLGRATSNIRDTETSK